MPGGEALQADRRRVAPGSEVVGEFQDRDGRDCHFSGKPSTVPEAPQGSGARLRGTVGDANQEPSRRRGKTLPRPPAQEWLLPPRIGRAD